MCRNHPFGPATAQGPLASVTETPSGASTTYAYDAAGRLLSENRSGAGAYLSSYQYEARGLRSAAFRSEGGVPSHDAAYAYDDAGRLTAVSDAVASSGLGGSYAWHPDGTLKSYPGPGYVRNLEYDEEGRLISIKKGSAPAFEYAYGFDGGRRWRKDLAAGSWTWYPCGVACGSGELVTMASDLSGSSWAVASTSLSGATSARVGGEWPLPDLSGGVAAVMDGTGNVMARPLLDGFGVVRNSATLSPALSRWARGSEDDEDSMTTLAKIDYRLTLTRIREVAPKAMLMAVGARPGLECINGCMGGCRGKTGQAAWECQAGCRAACLIIVKRGCDGLFSVCSKFPNDWQRDSCLAVWLNLC